MKPRITAIGSGKGGTGKTLIAVSLAHALAHQNERVLLCDADLGLSNASVHLGIKEGGDLAGLIAGRTAMKNAVVTVACGPHHSFDLLAAPPGAGTFANAGEAAAMTLIAAIEGVRNYDRVLIDLGAGVDAAVMSFAARADETSSGSDAGSCIPHRRLCLHQIDAAQDRARARRRCSSTWR